MKVITLELLQQYEACFEQQEAFSNRFGSEVEVSVEKAKEVALEFDFFWAIETLISYEKRVPLREAIRAGIAEKADRTHAARVAHRMAIGTVEEDRLHTAWLDLHDEEVKAECLLRAEHFARAWLELSEGDLEEPPVQEDEEDDLDDDLEEDAHEDVLEEQASPPPCEDDEVK